LLGQTSENRACFVRLQQIATLKFIGTGDGRQRRSGRRESTETSGALVELVQGFTGGDREIQAGLHKLYAGQGNWPSSFTKPFAMKSGSLLRKPWPNTKGVLRLRVDRESVLQRLLKNFSPG